MVYLEQRNTQMTPAVLVTPERLTQEVVAPMCANHTNSNSPAQSTYEYDIDPETGAVLIPLGGKKYPGRFALVDPQDVPIVAGIRWCPVRVGRYQAEECFYAMAKVDGRTAYMHRLILGLSGRNTQTDHINHNGIDNRRCNLRIVTPQQNQQNRQSRKGTSQFKGVSWHKNAGKWQAHIRFQGKLRHLGLFDVEREAAEVYDGAALMLFGSFACLNFPDEREAS